ncbi:MAG: amidophosphoribosyltransferase [Deltaproteobacteria bacterium CG11_big_fil_rev_8_21_14_0_20_42_23]|nr:MAG: amidophosphoribosyltransferase [Deltaproteobacteria bacterium CG11_big_fil_rev_8_21_14_0_20_42_23]PJC64341.1 MAG: amidophosphoribosyltransferase [Deltaproteobacteria bacterium CG_4_9_14_0_2_um_filter_42_21]
MCGVVGVFNHKEASKLAYLCLYAEQHRGQESAGIFSLDGKSFHQHCGMGLVADLFDQPLLEKLAGDACIGHVRYSTTGTSVLANAQPFVVNARGESYGIAHNGDITNSKFLKTQLEEDGAIFRSTMDTEVVMHLIAREKKGNIVDRITAALKKVEGAYSLTFLCKEGLVAARDPYGFRPLSIGKIGDGYIVVSETCALDLIDAEYVRDIEPGEIVLFNQEGIHSFKPFEKAKKRAKKCIFEYIYFARPDSHLFGRDVYPIRKGFGKQLANEFPVDADVVIPIPDSGVPAAIGYAEESGIPYELGLIRNHYVGRTFIEPVSEIRHFGVKLKLNPVREVLEGKRVIVVDDSIVRGTTSMKIVKMLRKAGAKEVHMRVSSPPTIGPCYYGIDTPDKKELTAANHSIEEIRKFIDADSLSYLSRDDLYWFEDEKNKDEYCDACFTENYPIMPKVR